jgi:hypothetical protein
MNFTVLFRPLVYGVFVLLTVVAALVLSLGLRHLINLENPANPLENPANPQNVTHFTYPVGTSTSHAQVTFHLQVFGIP